MLQVGSHWSRSTYQRVLVGSRAINTPHYLTTVPLARVAGGGHFYAVCARPDRASSRKITFTSPYAPVNGMPRKLTHERCLGHRRSSQSEELTTNGRRPSEGRVRRPLNPQIARAHGRSSPLHPMPLLKACLKIQLKRGF